MTIRDRDVTALGGRLSQAAAEAWVPRTCFKHGPPRRLGIEIEMHVHDARSPGRPSGSPAFSALRAAALRHPVDGRVTVEPGGQLELSSCPHDDLPAALASTRHDLDALRSLARDHRAVLVGSGHDPRPAPHRVLTEPRYAAMERYLDRWGPAGRAMMRSTASVQVNLEACGSLPDGSNPGPGDYDQRWDLLHLVGPALVAAFASSPGRSGPWTGWSSTRQAVWLTLDPARTAEPDRRPGESVPEAWTRWSLDAPLMMVRRHHGPWSAPPGTSFRDWIDAGTQLVPDRPGPTVDDLRYHLTTLFPPVRARGYLEVRYLDAQPGDWWQVPVSVLHALVTDAEVGRRVADACRPHRSRWWDAARLGLRDPGLARAAVEVLAAASTSLDADPRTRPAASVVHAYLERWTLRGRNPADDLLEGRPIPAAPDSFRRCRS